jgi:Fe-S cluster assembly protein SufD
MSAMLDRYVAEWTSAGQLRRRAGSTGLARTREAALQRFVSLGFPTTREEEWRFTSVAPIADGDFALAEIPSTDVLGLEVDSLRLRGAIAELVFVNGHYVPALSRGAELPGGASVTSLRCRLAQGDDEAEGYLARLAPRESHAFVALNTAFLDDGAHVHVPAGAILPQPVHVLFIATGDEEERWSMAHPRVLVVVGADAEGSIVETYAGRGVGHYFTNAVTEIVLGENATLDHYKLQYESAAAYHVGVTHVQAKRSATYTSHSVSLGGALVRNEVTALLEGEGAECTLDGLYLAADRRLVDTHTIIDHARPHCSSREFYKGILADRARGVFNGRIIVRPDAQKTDAKQTNRALLLSEEALIHTTPQLEIFANDVKCTHGAAVGQLDDDAVFYLRSRGLSHAAARHMLIHAFAADVTGRLPLEEVRTAVEARLQRHLAQALAAA